MDQAAEKRSINKVRACPVASYCPIAVSCEEQLDARSFFLQAGEIYTVNKSGRSIFIIVSGLVLVTFYDTNGETISLSIHGAGDVLNISQAVSSIRRSYSITALAVAEICCCDVSTEIDLAAMDSESLLNMVDAVTDNVGSLAYQIWVLLGTSVQKRVVRFLRVACAVGLRAQTGKSLAIKITQEQFAHIVNADRTSVAAALRAIHDQGIIDYSYGNIVIHASALDGLPL